MAVGDVEEVHFVLFGMPTYSAYAQAATKLLGAAVGEEPGSEL